MSSPVTFFVVPHRGATVTKFGMTSCPCLSNDPGGGVAEPDVDGPLIDLRSTQLVKLLSVRHDQQNRGTPSMRHRFVRFEGSDRADPGDD